MDEKKYIKSTKEPGVERTIEDISQDIDKGKENIYQTVEQIGERIEEKLDWREYVKHSPYWAVGTAAGLGYLAAKMFETRTTPVERILNSIAGEVHDSLGGLLGKATGPGLIKMTLLSIATESATVWIKNAKSAEAAEGRTIHPS